MLPLPPLRFSMMTGWPHFACNLSPTMRASTSLVPPLGYGTRNFTGLVGYRSCPNVVLDPGGGTIDRMKMEAKAANHRTMGKRIRLNCGWELALVSHVRSVRLDPRARIVGGGKGHSGQCKR